MGDPEFQPPSPKVITVMYYNVLLLMVQISDFDGVVNFSRSATLVRAVIMKFYWYYISGTGRLWVKFGIAECGK